MTKTKRYQLSDLTGYDFRIVYIETYNLSRVEIQAHHPKNPSEYVYISFHIPQFIQLPTHWRHRSFVLADEEMRRAYLKKLDPKVVEGRSLYCLEPGGLEFCVVARGVTISSSSKADLYGEDTYKPDEDKTPESWDVISEFDPEDHSYKLFIYSIDHQRLHLVKMSTPRSESLYFERVHYLCLPTAWVGPLEFADAVKKKQIAMDLGLQDHAGLQLIESQERGYPTRFQILCEKVYIDRH